MFNKLPESAKVKDGNKKRLVCFAVISFIWLLFLSTSTIANIIFYDAKLEDQPLELLCFCDPPPPPPPGCNNCNKMYSVLPRPRIIWRSSCNPPLKIISRVAPDYPSDAKEMHISGNVKVEITINEEGNVVCAKAVTGDPILQPSAINAALQWKFIPNTLNGKPTIFTGTLTFNFIL